LLQPSADFLQQPVAGPVSEHVVDFLEPIEIDANQGEDAARANCAA
jgi:hypothetical protein